MASSQKDVIYIDVDDEITAVIEKLQSSDGKIVALVLPKRATVFQSTVNMRLLKRSAANSKKNLVLITSEQSIVPLAGVVGIHVASTLQSKPMVPPAPSQTIAPVTVDEIEIDEPDESPIGPKKSVGALAAKPALDDEETIEIDDDDTSSDAKTGKVAAAGAKKSFNKKLKVPDFNRFRTRLILGGVLLFLLIGGFVFASMILPKAKVTIKTNSTEVPSSIVLTTSPTITEFDADKSLVPGVLKEYKRTEVQKAPATGQKDMGTKASGSATLSLTDCSKEQVTVPAGTVVSSGNFNFITQADVSMQSVKIGPNCRNSDFKNISTAKVSVTAQNAGDSYNLSARNYSVTGFSNVSGAGEVMSGGTSKIIKVVSQQDIDNLRQRLVETVGATANEETVKLLKDENYFALADTFVTKDPVVTSNPGVDAEAEEVTVSVTLAYTMAGASREGLDKLLETAIKQKIDTSQQKILNNGLDTASIIIQSKKPNGETKFELQVKATAGVEQNENDIKAAVAGKKKNEAESAIRSRPGIQEVTVEYSPFWVSKVPKKQSKIDVVFQQQNTNSSNE